MSVAQRSRERVEDYLASLEESYSSFPVNQTTVTVSESLYERARERCSERLVEVYVTVYDDTDDVLVRREDGEWELPHAEPTTEDRLEQHACREVRATTGVECSITGLEQTTILGTLDETDPDREPVYRLVTVFAGRHVSGSAADPCTWRSEVPETAVPTY